MNNTAEISEERNKTQLVKELTVLRFRNLGQKYFFLNDTHSSNYLQRLTDNVKFLHFSLPKPLNEIFININEAPFYWALSTPLNEYVEEHLKPLYLKKNVPEVQLNIKNFYSKWINASSPEEAERLAGLTINSLKKYENEDFYNLIIHSIISVFEPTFFEPDTALKMIDTALQMVEAETFDSKFDDELKYIFKLYKGFIHIKLNNIAEANEIFTQAVINKPTGISAVFYKNITELILNKSNNTSELIQEIYNFDIERIKFAQKMNSISIFNYFLKNNIISSIFDFEDLSFLSEEFELFFKEQKLEKETRFKQLGSTYINFRRLSFQDYLNDDIEKSIKFFENYLKAENLRKNILFYSSVELAEDKLEATVNSIIDNIKDKFYSEIDENLIYYDNEAAKIREKISTLEHEKENAVEKTKSKLKKSIEQIEYQITGNISQIEKRLNNLNFVNAFNPIYSFKNSITYSFVISLLIFLVAGMAHYSNSSIKDVTEIRNTFTLFIIPGIKWGVISFLLGFLISIASSISAWMERSNQKQRMIQRINILKNEMEREKKEESSRMQRKEKRINEVYQKTKEEYEYNIESLLSDKRESEIELQKEANEKIDKESIHLKKIIKKSPSLKIVGG